MLVVFVVVEMKLAVIVLVYCMANTCTIIVIDALIRNKLESELKTTNVWIALV